MRSICLLKAVTHEWFTNIVSFAFVIDYIRYCSSFGVLPAKVKSPFSSWVLRALNEQCSAPHGPNTVHRM